VGFGMKSGTSPSIASPSIAGVDIGGGGFFVAFQANTGHLWALDKDTGAVMRSGTSPSAIRF
jgi:hypothetical protein